MPVTRRRFLGVAACAVPGALAGARLAAGTNRLNAALIARRNPTCTLVDLEGDCVLRESLDGFRRGLGASSAPFDLANADQMRRANLIVVPGAAPGLANLAPRLRDLAHDGATVIYESGAAYAEADGFGSERRLLARYFGIEIAPPIDLWPMTPGTAFAPYVHYEWPGRVMVRDFSRATPVVGGKGLFARLGEAPVAQRVQVGAGEFIFLGSPLGPHLWSGDREAQTLLEGFVRFCQPA